MCRRPKTAFIDTASPSGSSVEEDSITGSRAKEGQCLELGARWVKSNTGRVPSPMPTCDGTLKQP
jgi:hypothetical protein